MRFGFLGKFTPDLDLLGAQRLLDAKGIPIDDGNIRKDRINLLVLFGGEDISPWYYGQKPKFTSASSIPSARDAAETLIFQRCLEEGIPVLAICRGAQLACVLLGGKLWQHVDNHEGQHHEVIVDGVEYETNSYHHQMMIPGPGTDVIGYCRPRSFIKCSEVEVEGEDNEAEILFNKEKRVLMIQGHPEWQSPKEDLFLLTQKLILEKNVCNL